MKFGRKPRKHDKRVPLMSALTAGQVLSLPPVAVNYTTGIPANLGMMLNDQLNDCCCAAVGHALEVWSFNAAGQMLTDPNNDVQAVYERSCGYTAGNAATDQGCILQDVLGYWVKQGVPTPSGTNKLAAFVEIDPDDGEAIRRAIDDCGCVIIGFNVPYYLATYLTNAGALWDYWPKANNSIVGGHAVILAGYRGKIFTAISWGALYSVSWRFLTHFMDECYALADASFLKSTGNTPSGLTLAQLEAAMQGLKQ
jgi:hypothetical protein